MRKSTKIWLIVATSLLFIGAAIFTAMLAISDWDFTNLSTEEYKTESYTSLSPITDISINSTTADITFHFTEINTAKVICYELEDATHNVSFQNGNLNISQIDLRKWYDHIGINFDTPKIEIYLPRNNYGALTIDVTTGDISIPSDFTFESIAINGSTCDIELNASTSGPLAVDITTGDIKIENAEFGTVALLASTGDMDLNNVKSNIIYTSATTGDITLTNVIAEKNLNITRTTGDVIFINSDAEAIYIQLDTGDVTGNLLTGKIFSITTSTGEISVPQNADGGTCVITTTTGDIELKVKIPENALCETST